MNLGTPFFILSAARSDLDPAENLARCKFLDATLHRQGIVAVHCTGSYQGIVEPALLVNDETPGETRTREIVLRLARVYEQESVLFVDANRYATLIYCDDEQCEERLGFFVGTSRDEAEQRDAWIERDGRYFITIN